MSAKKAWFRLQEKHSPSSKTYLSPIKHICYNSAVDALMTQDPYTKPQIWALLTLEEFYYQNSCLTVYHEFHHEFNMSRILRDSRLVIKWSERLKSLTLIGQGAFGDVYKGEDENTKKMFALKKVVKREDMDYYAESFIKDILLEKGTLYELNKSSFFVRLVGAFQEMGNGAYWLVMEYCICDLTKLVKAFPQYKDDEYLTNEYVNGYLLFEVNEFMSDYYGLDYKKLVFQYLFELLCGMHYLSRRHIVHTDLKTDNVLIGQNGHIKIGDFGLAFNDSWFHRKSIKMLVTTDAEKCAADNADKGNFGRGNTLHYDAELSVSRLIQKKPKYLKRIVRQYSQNPLFQMDFPIKQVFLTDIYAVGFIVVQLLFGGLNLKVKPDEFEEFVWHIDITFDEYIFDEFILRKFLSSATDVKEYSVMKFLASLFSPRAVRADGYVEDIRIFSKCEEVYESAINIYRVEQLEYYKSIKMEHMNVLNSNMPEEFINLLKKNSQEKKAESIQLASDDEARKVMNLPTFAFTDSKYLK